jgi:hypothetical protein
MAEEVKESKLDVLKQAITDFVNADVNDLRDTTKKSEFLDAFKTILKSEDSGVYSWLEKVLPAMKTEADKLGITVDAKEEFEPESEEATETPTAEETPEETPEETTEEVPAEENTEPEVKTESVQMTRGEFLVEVANNFID